MEWYIIESLAAGIKRLSSSLLGVGFFFKEKDKSLRPCVDYWGLGEDCIQHPLRALQVLDHALWTQSPSSVPGPGE